jgi:NAD(P)-dependent dehydrogenase (short-subunit alcohol dehydrogenase family)
MIGDRLQGKIAIVTGSGAGIGQGCALMFARQGAKVVGCDIDPTAAESTVAIAGREGLEFTSVHPCDMTEPKDVDRLIASTIERHGGFDILLNAGAWGAFKSIEDMDYETDFRKTISTELDVVFLACKAAWPHLKARGGGSIINFASINAWSGLANNFAIAHSAGKGAVLAMTRELAVEGAPHDIRVNTISPGMVLTAATKPRHENEPGFTETTLTWTLLKRLGQPEDIAWCAVYLASDESSWVTAADFSIDGGAKNYKY